MLYTHVTFIKCIIHDNIMHLSMAPPLPHSRVAIGWGNSGDLVPCQEPLPWGVTRFQYSYLLPRIDKGLLQNLTYHKSGNFRVIKLS